MDPLKFQVDVEKATPACSADCPNLNINIDIKTTCFMEDGRECVHKSKRIRCVNDEYCRRLYAAFDEERNGANSSSEFICPNCGNKLTYNLKNDKYLCGGCGTMFSIAKG